MSIAQMHSKYVNAIQNSMNSFSLKFVTAIFILLSFYVSHSI
jgi:hypothetical protein